jgi:hypothetical protein
MMLKQHDIHGNTVLGYISKLKQFNFLQINHINRIVNQMWESKTDIGGSMFDLSTTYYLTCTNKLSYQEDNEPRKRFNSHKSEDEYNIMPHQWTLAVWKKSMSLRYAIEILLYFAICITFQFEISAFNYDLHLASEELAYFDLLNQSIISHGGTAYDPKDPHRLISSVISESVHEDTATSHTDNEHYRALSIDI